MGQVPAKYLMPSAPYGQSDAVNAVNSVQPAAINPQTPLLPPNFTDPGTTVRGANPVSGAVQSGGLGQMFGGNTGNPFTRYYR